MSGGRKRQIHTTTAPRWLQNILKAFPTVTLFNLVNITIYFAFIFGVARSFANRLLKRAQQIIIGIAIWGVRQRDISGDMVAEIFSLPRLGPPTCVIWRRTLLLDGVSSSSHPLDPGQHFLLYVSSVGLRVICETMWEDECGHNIIITSDHMQWSWMARNE